MSYYRRFMVAENDETRQSMPDDHRRLLRAMARANGHPEAEDWIDRVSQEFETADEPPEESEEPQPFDEPEPGSGAPGDETDEIDGETEPQAIGGEEAAPGEAVIGTQPAPQRTAQRTSGTPRAPQRTVPRTT